MSGGRVIVAQKLDKYMCYPFMHLCNLGVWVYVYKVI